MKVRALIAMLLLAGLPSLALAQDGTGEPPAAEFLTWVTCPEGAHQVTVFSEGTAWNRGMKAAWLTVYNPTGVEQNVWLRVYADGKEEPLKLHQLLAPHARHAWHMNYELLGLEKPLDRKEMKDFNFASEVFFDTVGVANIAVWELGNGVPFYVRAAYLKGTDHCVKW